MWTLIANHGQMDARPYTLPVTVTLQCEKCKPCTSYLCVRLLFVPCDVLAVLQPRLTLLGRTPDGDLP